MAELLLQILIIAYASVGVVGIIGYIPTIKDLWQHKKMSANISSYIIWTATSGITVLYSTYILPDLLFRIVSALNFILYVLVLLLSLALQYRRRMDNQKR